MEVVLAALAASFITWLLVRSNYRGHIDDLRSALDYERRMRKSEEARAETLSDALFGRTETRTNVDENLKN